MKTRKIFITICLSFAVCILNGCSPSYPTEKDMAEAVVRLCKNEYGTDVKAKVIGKTLAVLMPVKGLFNLKNMQLSKDALDKIDGVMLSVSRVTLSGSSSIDFYTVVTADENVPGAEVVITRYVRDMRRFYFQDVSRGEFGKRMIIDIRFNPQAILDKLTGEFTVDDIKLEDFMCQQALHRIQDEFATNKDLIGKFKITDGSGELKERIFKFSVDIQREGLPMSELIHGKAWHEDVLLLSAKMISHVIWSYEYKNFDKISITNKFDNKVLEITKKDLNRYRKIGVKIDQPR